MNQFEGIFEFWDIKPKRLVAGNKLRIILKCPEDKELEKTLIDFREEHAKILITQNITPENKEDIVTIEDVFEIYDIDHERLKGGNKSFLLLENLYTKKNHKKGVDLMFNDVKIHMEKIDKDLFEKQQNESDDDEPEIEDPEGDK